MIKSESYSEAGEFQSVNKVVYCLLTIFLGYLGIHKFYAGKAVWGVLYLIFCWSGVPAILAVIDLIIELLLPSDNNGNIQL